MYFKNTKHPMFLKIGCIGILKMDSETNSSDQ